MYRVTDGLATAEPAALRTQCLLDTHFLRWAHHCDAEEWGYPPLFRVKDLERVDYFTNFPHLAVVAAKIRPEALGNSGVVEQDAVPAGVLTSGEFALPSAACYGVYFDLSGSTLDKSRYFTTIARCFRNEKEYRGLERLWSFQMREIVCVGDSGSVRRHLDAFRGRIADFAASLGIALELQIASDPFFDASSRRATMQGVFPVKEEFVYKESVAIASLNFHRNFFGERCAIRGTDGRPAFTGCVAFGIERWLHALDDHFEHDAEAIAKALEAATV